MSTRLSISEITKEELEAMQAAAPELLEALKAVQDWVMEFAQPAFPDRPAWMAPCPFCEQLDNESRAGKVGEHFDDCPSPKVFAAIAKAEGRS